MPTLRPHVEQALATRSPIPVTEQEAAIITGLAIQTLRNRRAEGRPPRYAKLGRKVVYQLPDLLAFVDGHVVAPRQAE